MDRGIPTEAVLADMRASDPPMQYVVGAPKGRRLSRLEKHLVGKPGVEARAGIQVKLLPQYGEVTCLPKASTAWPRNARCAGGS